MQCISTIFWQNLLYLWLFIKIRTSFFCYHFSKFLIHFNKRLAKFAIFFWQNSLCVFVIFWRHLNSFFQDSFMQLAIFSFDHLSKLVIILLIVCQNSCFSIIDWQYLQFFTTNICQSLQFFFSNRLEKLVICLFLLSKWIIENCR